jgi:two-component system nitrogen regulation response regulator GlnG
MPRKILVADDDAAMLNIYGRIFADTSYTLSKAASFSEAERLINGNTYDLLITDLLLQDGVGTDLIKLFEGKKAGARSLLVTGSVHEVPPEALPAVYFEKPFSLQAFMEAVEAALGVLPPPDDPQPA